MLYSIFIQLYYSILFRLFSCLDLAARSCYNLLRIMSMLNFPRGKECLQHFPNVFDSEILFLKGSHVLVEIVWQSCHNFQKNFLQCPNLILLWDIQERNSCLRQIHEKENQMLFSFGSVGIPRRKMNFVEQESCLKIQMY